MRKIFYFWAIWVVGCAHSPAPQPDKPPAAFDLWFRTSECTQCPTVIYLHGGPGYNAYAFEKAVAPHLEGRLRMVYFDQRGAGRSSVAGAKSKITVSTLVRDLERLRAHVRAPQVVLVGHSFGGWLALEYIRQHPSRVSAVVLVESALSSKNALEYQLRRTAQIARQKFPEHASALKALVSDTRKVMPRLMQAYKLVGAHALQRQLHFYGDAGQQQNRKWDDESGLLKRKNYLAPAIIGSGYFDREHPELEKKLSVPGLLIAGKASHVIGATETKRTAGVLGVKVQWIDKAGHFPYVERPKAFADAIIRFIEQPRP